MLPVVFEKFKVVHIFFATFFFSLSLSIGKMAILAKIWEGGGCRPPSLLGFYGSGWDLLSLGPYRVLTIDNGF